MPTPEEIAAVLKQSEDTGQLVVYEDKVLNVFVPEEDSDGFFYLKPYRLLNGEWEHDYNRQWEPVTNPVMEQQLNEIAKLFYGESFSEETNETTVETGINSKCGMCGYIGTMTDNIGQCPRCRWDELQPLIEESDLDGDGGST